MIIDGAYLTQGLIPIVGVNHGGAINPVLAMGPSGGAISPLHCVSPTLIRRGKKISSSGKVNYLL